MAECVRIAPDPPLLLGYSLTVVTSVFGTENLCSNQSTPTTGLVCERLKQMVLKTIIPAMVSGVRIPPNPPLYLMRM